MDEKKNARLTVEIVDEQLVIQIGIETLAWCAHHHPEFWDGHSHEDVPNIPVNDVAVFAREIRKQLLEEKEDGTTPVIQLLDDAITAAVENGCEGIADSFYGLGSNP